ncbi:MAG: creatininase family protein [Polyangiales bacterium]
MSESVKTIPSPPTDLQGLSLYLSDLTTETVGELVHTGTAIALIPIGSIEPHGPHLPLGTDAILSEEACRRSAIALRAKGLPAVLAPVVAYGVTRYARGFPGIVGVSEATLVALLVELTAALLDDGFVHVSLVNNHLEPAHIAAVSRAADSIAADRGPNVISCPNQVSKRWGSTLTAEFRHGDCHAGRYETSLVLAARKDLVREDLSGGLPKVAISLSDEMRRVPRADVDAITFQKIGMHRAYTGAPSEATVVEGESSYAALVTMVVTEIEEHLSNEEITARTEIPFLKNHR